MIFELNEGVLGYAENEDFFDGIQEAECPVEDPMLGATWVAIKMESAMRAFDEAVAISELEAVQETGTMAIYEVNVDGAKQRIVEFFEKAKETIKKIATYVKGFFIKVFKMLESMFATNNKFLKDNEDLLSKVSNDTLGKIKFTGYKYTNLESFNFKSELKPVKDSVAWANTDENTLIKQHRKLDKEYESDASYRLGLSKYFRDGESTKSVYTALQVYSGASGVIDHIKNKNKWVAQAKEDYKDAQAAIKNSIKAVEDAKKKALDATEDNDKQDTIMKGARKHIAYLQGVLKAQNVAHSEHVKAIKAACLQARSVAGAMIKNGTKIKDLGKKKVNESSIFDDGITFEDDEAYTM